jgi:uncharacterized protein
MSKTTAHSDLPIGLKLKQLYELQQIDSEVDQVQIVKGELPVAVSDLEDEIEGLTTRISKLEASTADMEKELVNHKVNIKIRKLIFNVWKSNCLKRK